MSTVEAVTEALAELAALGGPDRIAERLAAGGHRGRRTVACDCPVSAYVLARTGQAIGISPTVWVHDTEAAHGQVPRPVAEFIGAFDLGAYPDLVAPRAAA